MSRTLDYFWTRLKQARNAPRVREKIFADAALDNGAGFARSLRDEWDIWEADHCLKQQQKTIEAKR